MTRASEALQEVKTCPTWESCREELLSFHSAERHIAAIRRHPRPPRLDLGSTRSRRIRASEMAPFSGHHVKNEVEPNQYTPFYICVCAVCIYICYTLYYYIIQYLYIYYIYIITITVYVLMSNSNFLDAP
jgi:hypothetical protein